MAQSDFERKAEQIRSQLQNLRDSLDEVQINYSRLLSTGAGVLGQAGIPVRRVTRQAKLTVQQASKGIEKAGIAWWVPIAVIGVVGVGIWLFNQFVPRTEEQFINFPSGQ